ncbi:DUF397 domain-containing protein [Streptomyces sp. 110]|uniref:DUF397 domain-containing protein n=1 Tax=Streptomyces endocoffeicus TaxID=2898945 RepID=A0ABS1PS84_9ACTN|nr:DUF397 domain-containing protein [Streptomyces endocoffeicus]MBL1115295.1 DUF397 domain-containing protein [Streptomyces endocoffeicus]
MTTTADGLTSAAWFKSSYSNNQGAECVEGAHLSGEMAVRDSKDPSGPICHFSAAAWAQFITGIKTGTLDGDL